MVFNNNKKGQAAIEFLMTYGWMLLVVLIVGALIFSFVDFGSLLPNKLDLTGNLKVDSSQLISDSSTNTVNVVFTYVGAKASYINVSSVNLTNDLGFSCDYTTATPGVIIKNLDSGTIKDSNNLLNKIQFINGNVGVLTFDCTGATNINMLSGDVFEGNIVIPVVNTRTGLAVTSKGRIRVAID